MANKEIRMILAGAGFMGREHLAVARTLENVRYVGIVDPDSDRARKLGAEYGIPVFTAVSEAMAAVTADALDLCAPTPFHLDLIRTAADRGLHVLCEKPVARSAADADAILEIVRSSGIRFMVAMVLRFWPEYVFARDVGRDKTYGTVMALECKRLSTPPEWNGWMVRSATGGGAVVDLQIHDLDFALQLVGPPAAVQATGVVAADGAVNAVRSTLTVPGGPIVCTEASFRMTSSYPFRMFYRIDFEDAVLEMDFWRPKGRRLIVYPQNGEAFSPDLPKTDAYREEIRYFAARLVDGEPFAECPAADAVAALRLCLASETAVATGQPVSLQGLAESRFP